MSQVLTQNLTGTTYHISNQCGKDLLVLLASAPARDTLRQLYEQTLLLPDTGRQGSALPDGADAAVTINDRQDGTVYTLLFALAGNLFPVQVTPVVFNTGSASNITLQLTAQNRADMQVAEKFVQAVTALPSSGLASGYAQALGGGPKSVNDFFKSNPDYKSLTADKVVAVQTYYNSYPYIWANYAASKTYQLYSTDGNTTTTAGSLTITAPANAVASADKSNAGFQLTYRAPAGASQPAALQYAQGRFRNPQGNAGSIDLQGLFTTKAQLTGKEADKEITSMVKGTLNGREVLGYMEQQEGGSWISLDGLLHPGSVKDWLQLSGIVAGMAALLLAMGAAVTGVIYAVARKGKSQVDPYTYEPDTSDEEYEQQMKDNYEEWKVLKEKNRSRLLEECKSQSIELAGKQLELTRNIAQYADNASMQEVVDDLMDLQAALYTMQPAEFEERHQQLTSRLEVNGATLKTQAARVEQQMDAEDRQAIADQGTTVEQLTADLLKKEKVTDMLDDDADVVYDHDMVNEFILYED